MPGEAESRGRFCVERSNGVGFLELRRYLRPELMPFVRVQVRHEAESCCIAHGRGPVPPGAGCADIEADGAASQSMTLGPEVLVSNGLRLGRDIEMSDKLDVVRRPSALPNQALPVSSRQSVPSAWLRLSTA